VQPPLKNVRQRVLSVDLHQLLTIDFLRITPLPFPHGCVAPLILRKFPKLNSAIIAVGQSDSSADGSFSDIQHCASGLFDLLNDYSTMAAAALLGHTKHAVARDLDSSLTRARRCLK
jgi:hypothetical protein